MKKTPSLLAAVSLVCLFCGPLRAAGTKDAEREARRDFQEAEVHFRAGQFAEALSAYEAGYAQAPLPGFLINIAQCYRRLGDLTRARATYQKFVMVAPDSPHVAEVTSLIAEIDKLQAQLEAEAAAAPPTSGMAASGTGDTTLPLTLGAPAPSAPVPAPSLLEAPKPTSPTPTDSPPPSASAGKTRWWLWGLAGAAVVVAGGTAAAFALGGGTDTTHQGSLGALRR